MSQEIEEIKSKIDVVDLIGEYTKIIPAGVNFKTLCPFHNEKTPSFIINKQKQVWRCFGCGEGGDIFDFTMKMEGVEFGEALKILAQKSGVVLRAGNPKEENQKSRLMSLCMLAAKYWQKVLWESPKSQHVREYVKARGLDEETAENFMLGYAVESWDDLISFLKKKGYSDQEIFLAGLSVKKNQGSGFYDRFRDRLMFPILDVSGRVVGFGGRTLKKDEPAKYLNTPQTLIYNKSAVLYGLYQAKDAIKKDGFCILVEGYMDVIPSHQAGIKNVVAISGTALTPEQIKILKRYSNKISLALDMDTAGRQAASRSIDVALQEEMDIKVISLSQGKDPGECIKNNVQDWTMAINNAEPIMQHFYRQAILNRDVKDPADKKIIISTLSEEVGKLGKVEQDYWIRQIAQNLSVSETVLREILASNQKKTISAPTFKNRAEKESRFEESDEQDLTLLKRILALILVYPNHFSFVISRLPLEYLQDGLAIAIYKELVLYYNKNNTFLESVAVDNSKEFDLFDSLNEWFKENNSEASRQSVKVLTEIFLLSQKDFKHLDDKAAKAELDISLKILKDNYIKKRIEFLKVDLERAEKDSSTEEVKKIYDELGSLIKQKNS